MGNDHNTVNNLSPKLHKMYLYAFLSIRYRASRNRKMTKIFKKW